MTIVARVVLQDAKSELDLALTQPPHNESEWRRRIVTLLALLRAIGHVLRNVDGERDARMGEAVSATWNRLRAIPIFSDFIEQERNNILKQYVFPDVLRATSTDACSITVFSPAGTYTRRSSGNTILDVSLIESGPYAGREILEVIGEAIYFWGEYLDELDQLAAEKGRE